jgi:predicted MPP superfamily phosphohydrolase
VTGLRWAFSGLAAAAAISAGTLGYATGYEVRAFTLRRIRVPLLPVGSSPIRVLHLSDLHLTPRQQLKQRWVTGLAALEPDLVINTGDNLADPEAIPFVTRSLGGLLDRPGVFCWGSNDYYAPTFKNPIRYLTEPSRQGQPTAHELPWKDLRDAFTDAGWVDLTERRAMLMVSGTVIEFRGTNDAHLNVDNYSAVAGPPNSDADLAVGVTHSPYQRLLTEMNRDGLDLIFAGHTHGGQVCIPGYGAVVSNCDLDPRRAKGLSELQFDQYRSLLHVSAGLGTSPYAPIRFACRPEATLLTLVPRESRT